MSTAVFDIGDVAVLEWRVLVGDQPADPTTITVDVQAPDETVTHAEWAAGAGQVIRVQQGLYRYFHAPDQSGKHWVRWAGDGDVIAADEDFFRVRRRRVAAP